MISVLLGLIVGAGIGYFIREFREQLKRIELGLRVFVKKREQQEAAEKKMSYAGPMTMQELNDMEEEAKIEALNLQ